MELIGMQKAQLEAGIRFVVAVIAIVLVILSANCKQSATNDYIKVNGRSGVLQSDTLFKSNGQCIIEILALDWSPKRPIVYLVNQSGVKVLQGFNCRKGTFESIGIMTLWDIVRPISDSGFVDLFTDILWTEQIRNGYSKSIKKVSTSEFAACNRGGDTLAIHKNNQLWVIDTISRFSQVYREYPLFS